MYGLLIFHTLDFSGDDFATKYAQSVFNKLKFSDYILNEIILLHFEWTLDKQKKTLEQQYLIDSILIDDSADYTWSMFNARNIKQQKFLSSDVGNMLQKKTIKNCHYIDSTFIQKKSAGLIFSTLFQIKQYLW